MSTATPYNPQPRARAMKTRDKIKYTFATLLALLTTLAITGLVVAKNQRERTTQAEEQIIHQTISTYGTNGALPPKIELPEDSPMSAGPR